MYNVSSEFQIKLSRRSSEPVRKFMIGTSNYSDRVVKWPKLKRMSDQIRTAKASVKLDNVDGALNHFFETTYKTKQDCTLKIGFEPHISDDNLIGLWRFDEGFGKNAKDSSGTHETGGLYGLFNMVQSDTIIDECEVSSWWVSSPPFKCSVEMDGNDRLLGDHSVKATNTTSWGEAYFDCEPNAPMDCSSNTGMQFFQKADGTKDGQIFLMSASGHSRWDFTYTSDWYFQQIDFDNPTAISSGGVDLAIVAQIRFDFNSPAVGDHVWVDGLVLKSSWRDGKSITCLKFDGVDDYVRIGWGDMSLDPPISITGWLSTTTSGSLNPIFVGGAWSSPYDFPHLFITTDNKLGFYTTGGGWQVSSLTVNDGAWHQFAVTFPCSGGTGDFYIDKVHNGSFTVGAMESNNSYKDIGKAGGDQYKGFIDEFRLYDKVLSAAEIEGLYDNVAQDYMDIFKGNINNVRYTNRACTIKLTDKIDGFSKRIVGDVDNPVTFSGALPSDIAWTLCTCYGDLCSSKDVNNDDINYTAFNTWAAQFSADSIVMDAHFEDIKITEALLSLGKMTDSAIWSDSDGKIYFKKFTDVGSQLISLSSDNFTDILIDVDKSKIVNKAYVLWDYSVGSKYWQKRCYSVDSTSVDSFGLHEEEYRDGLVWYVNSLSAINLAERHIIKGKNPPKSFKIKSDLYLLRQNMGDIVTIVDSFYGLNKESGWMITETDVNMDNGTIDIKLSAAVSRSAFYLDISYLDGDDLLL